MVLNTDASRQMNSIAEPDEGWWAAILADEETLQPKEETSNLQHTSGSVLSDIDWGQIKKIFEEDEIIILEVIGHNRGGLLVQGDHIQGFVPLSHLIDLTSSARDGERQNQLEEYSGRMLELKVIECEPAHDRIVFSERAAQAGEGKRIQLFRTLKCNDIVEGVVTNVTDFGVFVDLGGVEGLIHVSELSWGRVQHPGDILQVNQGIKAQVLQVNEDNGRVALSLKRLHPNPWNTLQQDHKLGDKLSAQITSVMHYGAFARLEEGIEGLIHVSSMSLPDPEIDPSNIFHSGQPVEVEILHIDSERRRLGLGLVISE
jgi:small subunit ribosomal protein S1